MDEYFCGHSWANIQRAQRGGSLGDPVDTAKIGDHGADPIGNGFFRMVPSGDIVTLEERNLRLSR